MNARPEELRRPNAGECERIFHAALAAGDTKGVEAALTVMAPQDPRRAQRLYDELKTALAVVRMLSPGSSDLRYPENRPGWLGEFQAWPCGRCGREVDDSEKHECKPSEGANADE